ncbi:MAG TPA: DUF1292 domain-containing protein [Defluviitaleaceae bacterium]|jgi:hypothetical protein|nr:DUF1292 domain-containing protein [Defluviitaleaceae bacterium]HPT75395.1 DUF1292 domain-containing protein [Defluviitaleaceae bacterium]HQD50509.1 DUF1292 domain-containing protein [Defluviitaleaceae bacterium]
MSGEFKTVFLTDEETGEEVGFEIIDAVEVDGNKYLLVVLMEEDEAQDRAYILKDISQDDKEAVYRLVDDDEEFNKIAVYFMEDNNEYEIEI